MAIPVALTRKRGNLNWGRPIPPAPALATEFELRVKRLQLTPEMYTSSVDLVTCCEKNRNGLSVPKCLLEEWRITLAPAYGDAASPPATGIVRLWRLSFAHVTFSNSL